MFGPNGLPCLVEEPTCIMASSEVPVCARAEAALAKYGRFSWQEFACQEFEPPEKKIEKKSPKFCIVF